MILRDTRAVQQSPVSHLAEPGLVPPLQPRAPAWVTGAMAGPHTCSEHRGVTVSTSGSLALLTTSLPRADAMPADALRAAVADAYDALRAALSDLGTSPIRFWNYLPDPAHPMAPGIDRYMVFNAGRFDGYGRRSTAAPGDFRQSLATASAVGFSGSDLVIHCLASRDAGTPVENPRQTPPWRYSSRYGPLPPCFSRATIATLHGRAWLLVGGTASIVGEDSRHAGDVDAQLDETMRNIASVIGVAQGGQESPSASLARLTDVRAYVVRAGDAEMIRSVLEQACAPAARVELALSGLCRPELLVEIEGVAGITPRA